MASGGAKYGGRAKSGPNKGKLRVSIPTTGKSGKKIMKTYHFKNR